MTAEEMLDEIIDIDLYINKLMEEKNKVYIELTRAGINEFGDKVQTSSGNTHEEKLVRYVSYNERIDAEIDRLFDLKETAMDYMDRLSRNVYKAILMHKYFDRRTYGFIGDTIGYEESHVRRLAKEAICELDEIMHGNERKCPNEL